MVFDIGGVLLDWDPRYLYRKLISDPAEMEWFLAKSAPRSGTSGTIAGSAHGVLRGPGAAVAAVRRPDHGVVERGEEMVPGRSQPG